MSEAPPQRSVAAPATEIGPALPSIALDRVPQGEATGGVRFEQVWKLFKDDTPAVANLNLEIEEGEFLVFVGPSGCGKTTSLRMLAGLERPTYGRIMFGERDVTTLPPGQRDVAMVFQSYALYPNMTVYKNLSFGPTVRGEPRQGLRARIEEVAAVLGIETLLDRRPTELSGGQRQRVALGRALIREPALFLLDEPLSNLDAALRVQMRGELIRLHRSLGRTTTVYVTHDQVEALTMGDRVAVLKDGDVMQVATPACLYENPTNAFVATFIGSPTMNTFTGRLKGGEQGSSFDLLGSNVPLHPGQAAALSAVGNTEVLAGLRPTDLRPSTEFSAAVRPGRLDAVIDVIEHSGSEVFATVRVADQLVLARLPRNATPRVGERIELAFDPRDLYFFDITTRERLLDREAVAAEYSTNASSGSTPIHEVRR